MNFFKFKSLSIWEKLGVIGSIASIVSIVIYFLPDSSSALPATRRICANDPSEKSALSIICAEFGVLLSKFVARISAAPAPSPNNMQVDLSLQFTTEDNLSLPTTIAVL